MMEKRILALDMATCTGWATGTNSGSENFRKRAGDSRGMIYIRFEAWLVDIGGMIEPDLIVYERPHARGRAANELLNGMLAILQKYCEQCKIEYTDCPSSTLKKFATGNGVASKKDMMTAYERRWAVAPLDDNEADAKWLHEWAQDQFNNMGSTNAGIQRGTAPKRGTIPNQGEAAVVGRAGDEKGPASGRKKAVKAGKEGEEKTGKV